MLISTNKANRVKQKLWNTLISFFNVLSEWKNKENTYTDTIISNWLDPRTFEHHLGFIRKREKNWKIRIALSEYNSFYENAKKLEIYFSSLDKKSAKIFSLVLFALNQK